MISTPTPPTVIVVGAGPAGLTAAIALVRHGIPTLVVERRTAPSPFPRATGVNLRTMELMRAWGLEDAVRAGAIDGEHHRMDRTNARVVRWRRGIDGLPVGSGRRAAQPHHRDHRPAGPPRARAHGALPLASAASRSARHRVDRRSTQDDGRRHRDASRGRRDVDRSCRLRDRRRRCTQHRSPARRASRCGARATWAPISRSSSTLRSQRSSGEPLHGLYMLTRQGPPWVFLPTDRRDRWAFSMTWDPRARRCADYPPRASRRAHPIGRRRPRPRPGHRVDRRLHVHRPDR